MTNFFIGQKVVSLCSTWVHANWWLRQWEKLTGRKTKDPIEGRVYTISGFEEGRHGIYLFLEECEPSESYIQSEFRPAQSKSMEIFRRIAANPKIKIREPA